MILSKLFLQMRLRLWKLTFGLVLLLGVVLVIQPPFLVPSSHAGGGNSTLVIQPPFLLPSSHAGGGNSTLVIQPPFLVPSSHAGGNNVTLPHHGLSPAADDE